MTIPSETARARFEGNGSTTEFPTGFRIDDADEIAVWHTSALGVESRLTVDVDYTVEGVGEEAGATVTYPVTGDELAEGEYLTLLRDVPMTQETNYEAQDSLFPDVVERDIDRIVERLQQHEEVLSRCPKATPGSGQNGADVLAGIAASEAAAAASASTASGHASNAHASAGQASDSASDAAGYATTASGHADTAESARDSALGHRDAAEGFATDAAKSAGEAAAAGQAAAEAVVAGKLDADGSTAWTGDQDADGNTVTNLAAPTADDDAATKKYVDDNAGGGGFAWTSLVATTDFATTRAAADQITMNSDQTGNIFPGMLVEITSGGVARPYRVSAITPNFLTVNESWAIASGAGAVTAIRYNSRRDAIGYVEFHVAGNWCDGTDTALLEHDLGWKGGFAWPLAAAKIVGISAVERVNSGSPVLMLTVGGSDALDAGIIVGTTAGGEYAYVSGGETPLDVAPGDAIELACTTAVASGNNDLTVGLWYFVEGSV